MKVFGYKITITKVKPKTNLLGARRWTQEETALLLLRDKQKVSYEHIAKELNRTKAAIACRISKINMEKRNEKT